jgi:bacterioferritin (cytochrome b1)
MSFKISIASLKETLESERDVINATLKEMSEEGVKETTIKNLLTKLGSDIDSFVTKINADFGTGLKEYDMVKFLNNMLKLEYQGIFDYNYYASQVTDSDLAEKLRTFGSMEIEHAHMVIEKIKKLGAKPKIPGAAKRSKFKNVLEMLKAHAASEKEAIRLCEEGIELFEDPEFHWILGTIRVDEIDHQKEIKALIKKFESIDMAFTIQSKYNPPKKVDYDSDEPWTEG